MQDFGYSQLHGLVASLLLYVASLLLCACFLALVPQRKTWFTALGAATLYGYLLHGFVLRGALAGGWFDHHWVYTPQGELAVTVVAAAVVTALCTEPVRRVFRYVMEPEMRWAFRRDNPRRRAV
jgi:fucose 4-O-acetylase-like acetyltransferase